MSAGTYMIADDDGHHFALRRTPSLFLRTYASLSVR